MDINRHNYEMYFLLYVDNELSQEERALVEAFAEHNADLAVELALLQETVLPGEPVSFDKSLLLKHEDSINLENYQEYFLLYVDNELDANDKNEVEKFVLHHPELQDEFTLFNKTRLPEEPVIFKDKAVLYRTVKETKVVRMVWMRIAVAAALFALVSTLWILYPKHTTGDQQVATKTESVKPADKQQPPVMQPKEAPAQMIASTTETVNQQKLTEAPVKKHELVPAYQAPIAKEKPEEQRPVIESGNKNQLPIPDNNPVFAQNNKKKDDLNISNNPVVPKGEIAQATAPSFASQNNNGNIAPQHAVYKELVNEEDEQERGIFIGGTEINKNKLRGLLKKATNLFDKRKRSDDGNTVNIAGFEIKSK